MLALECVVNSLEKVSYSDRAGSSEISIGELALFVESDSSNLSLSLAYEVSSKCITLNVPSTCGHRAVALTLSYLRDGSCCVKNAVSVLCSECDTVESAKNDLAVSIGNDSCNGLCGFLLCEIVVYNNADSEVVVLFGGSIVGVVINRRSIVVVINRRSVIACDENDCNYCNDDYCNNSNNDGKDFLHNFSPFLFYFFIFCQTNLLYIVFVDLSIGI